MRNLILIVCLLSASLMGEAKIVVPDSMLNLWKAYAVTSPDTSLAIIQTLRERQLEPDWRLDMAEGDYCFATLQYTRSLKLFNRALASPEIKDSCEAQMQLLKRLMDTHDILLNDDSLVTCIYKLRKQALACNDDAFLAMADFMRGKRTHYHRKKAEGYELCLGAVELMKSTNYYRKQVELCCFYADLLIMYAQDGRPEDALRMSLLQEEAARSINAPFKKTKHSLRHVFALRASLLAKAGRKEEADLAYAKWKMADEGNCLTDKPVLDYLILNHYEDARKIVHDNINLLRSLNREYSYNMVVMLVTGVQVENALGDYNEAAAHSSEVRLIVDSIHVNASKNQMVNALDLIKKEEDVKEKSNLVTMLIFLLVLGAVAGTLVLYYTRVIRHRNKALLKVLNSLDAYRRIATGGKAEEPPVERPAADAPDDSPSKENENESLFVKLDGQITRDKLFLNPNFGRDDMARLIGVDKNRIGHIMANYSSASNASVYINTKRVEYGAKLLVEHPEYTIAAIASECGMSNTVTFNRTFKEVYGMTPSEYRTNMRRMAGLETTPL